MDILESKDVELLFKKLVIVPQDLETENKEASEAKSATKAKPDKIAKHPTLAKGPNAILVNAEVSVALLRNDSNFSKITNSLGISWLKDHLVKEEELQHLDQLRGIGHLWCIAISDSTKELLEDGQIADVIFTDNPEILKSVEDKKALFAPVKAFAGRI